ncbi:hypothetical protein PCANC_25595 [Puccinia coronata f. sp. avenae]|uniref:FAS1 domain-containing protein n=1 Tax=Puccinia coronata f. sp. avenae TaxID=200324 RepID=A0A2N5TMN9_9BASI|nr:hypothetical protein PCANC_25595 [Puccinia coronata f. sp. avenae]
METQTTTLIDLLSASADYLRLLHLIQITQLVPVINALPTVTLFAPTNSSLEETLKAHQDTTQQQQDNVQLQLRQTLLYHLLNFTLPLNQTSPKDTPEPLDTLLFPKPTHLLNLNNINNNDNNNKNLLLGHQAQKLSSQQATNGILVPIQSILTQPPLLKKSIQSTPALSTYASILPEQLLDQLDLLPHLTIFAPHNHAWDHLSPIELRYLKSNFSTNDSIKLFCQAATDNFLAPEGIDHSHLLRHKLHDHKDSSLVLLSLDGKHLSITLNPLSNPLAINGTEMVEQDILASNGVLHIVPNLLISDGDNPFQLTPDKYLLGLNCTKFGALFWEANLSTKYLGNLRGEKSYTILAVRNNVLRSTTNLSSSSTTTLQINLTVIYILPPSDLVQVALSDLCFSTGVASLFLAKLDYLLKAVPKFTYLMPTNKAFAKLGLIKDYLLLEKSRPDLQVLKYHAVTEVIYLNKLKMGTSQWYPTLEGTELYIPKLASHNVTLHKPTVGGKALKREKQDSKVINRRDVLIENGSMQFIDQVELPGGVNIGLRKLMMGAKATTMLELIQASNLSWILDLGIPCRRRRMGMMAAGISSSSSRHP